MGNKKSINITDPSEKDGRQITSENMASFSDYYTPLEPSLTKENDKEAVVKAKKKGIKFSGAEFKDTFQDNVLSVRGTIDGTLYGFDITVPGKIGTRKITVEKDLVKVVIPKESTFSIQLQTMQ